jgi:hypothetical protein
MLSLRISDAMSMYKTNDLSEYLGEDASKDIIQNMEIMDFDELIEFKRSLEIISKAIKVNYH